MERDSILTITYSGQPVLSYHYGLQPAPVDTDPLYARSGFIHPLYSPAGDVLTQIQPEDHYHHYGIWNPWTHVLYDGDTLDFWNLKKGQGTVRFAKFLAKETGKDSCFYEVVHEHVILKESPIIPLTERQKVTLHRSPNSGFYTIDFRIEYSVEGEKPFTLLEYRYGGFTWRVTKAWKNNTCEVMTSTGKSRNEADGEHAEWFYVQGPLPHGYGGILLLSHPHNFNQPEPLRIWPESKNPPSGLMVNFSPTKNTDWTLQPGNKYELNYRMVVYSDSLNVEKARAFWKEYKAVKRE